MCSNIKSPIPDKKQLQNEFDFAPKKKVSSRNFKKLIFMHFQKSVKKAASRNIKSLKTLLKRKETAIFESHFKNEI